MRRRNRKGYVDFPAFGYVINVIESHDMKRTCAKLGTTADGSEALFIFRETSPPTAYLVFRVDATIEHIAHESCHAVRHMLKRAGVRLDDEIFAYHLGYLVEKVWKFLK